MPEKPSEGGTKTKYESKEKVFSPSDMERAYKVIFHEGPEVASKEEIQDAQVTSKTLHKVVNYHKGPIAKLRDALFDTDIGAGIQLFAVGAVAVVGGVAAAKYGKSKLGNGKKEIVVDSETPLGGDSLTFEE